MKRVVLLEDTDPEFCAVLIELLGDKDYDFRQASYPEETRSILRAREILIPLLSIKG